MKSKLTPNKSKECVSATTTTTSSQSARMAVSSFMMSRTEIQKVNPEKENAFHSLMKSLPRSKRSKHSSKRRNNSRMTFTAKDLKASIRLCNSRERMSRSTSSKKNYPAPNSSTETDTTPLPKTSVTLNKSLKKESRVFLKISRSSSKRTETPTLRRCLRMLPSSKSSKPRRKKRQETSKKPLLMSLNHITRKSMLSWTSIMLRWNPRQLRLSR